MSNPSWLKNAVFYEIYPQSFCDTNGDGIGDLPGVIEKLDYVKSLGATAIWLNPCFESPFQDAGYDVSDFYKVAPRYGTNADLEKLFAEAHKRGLKVILDLVAGHTSIEHPWFKDSCKGPGTEYSDWYIWTDNAVDDPPEKYRFLEGYGERNALFMYNFFYFQPALNYGFCDPDPAYPWQKPATHPAVQKVRQELKNIMKFWLDMGCDGFRVDMAPSLIRGDKAEDGIKALWQEYRSWLEKEYPQAVLVSEWSLPPKAVDAGFHIDFMVHVRQRGYTQLFRLEKERVGSSVISGTGRSFFDLDGLGDATGFFTDLTGNLEATQGKGYVAVPTGNHDMGRIRGKRSLDELKVVHTFLLLLPGVPFIYYGDEIGMDNVYGAGNKEGGYSRSVARTPMQWTADEKGGFSKASPDKFYLPLDPAPDRPNVAEQEKDPQSLLNFTRELIALRHSSTALSADGNFRVLYAKQNQVPVIYERFDAESSYVIAVNPSGREVSAYFALPDADCYEMVLASGGAELLVTPGATKLILPPVGYAVYRKKEGERK